MDYLNNPFSSLTLDWSTKEFDTHTHTYTHIHMLRSHQFSRWKVYNNSIYSVSTTLIAISCTVSLPLKEISRWKCWGGRHKELSKSRNLGIPRNSTISSTSLPNRFKKYFLCHLTFRQKYTRCPSVTARARFYIANAANKQRDESVRIHNDVGCTLNSACSRNWLIFFYICVLDNLNKNNARK